MTEFRIRLAEEVIGVSALYPSTRAYCQDYLSDEEPTFSVSLAYEDIIFEREKSRREDELEGIAPREFPDEYLETLALYRKIATGLVPYGVILFHGSVLALDGEGYLFTAKSGTGKSTHTRLWRKVFGERVIMVNDDKPLLRIKEDSVVVYGTPWDGKHHLSTNISVPLKAICVLKRGAENTIRRLGKKEVFPVLLRQSYRPGDPLLVASSLRLLDTLAENTRQYELHCNMEDEAALVAYKGMNSL